MKEQFEVGKKEKGRIRHLAWILTCIYGAALFLWNFGRIFDQNYWGDEAFTVCLVRENISGIIAGTAQDVHPPLYYLILKPFIALLGERGPVFHGVSLLAMALTLILCVTEIYRKMGKETAWILMTHIGMSPLAVRYNVEVRMYSWGAFFLLLSFLFLYRIFLGGERKGWTGFFLTALVASYTHYYCFLGTAVLLLCLLVFSAFSGKRMQKKAILLCLGEILLYLPWLFMIQGAVAKRKENYWIKEIPSLTQSLNSVWGKALSYPLWVFLLILITARAAAELRIVTVTSGKEEKKSVTIQKKERKRTPLCLSWGKPRLTPYSAAILSGLAVLFGTYAAAWVISVLYRPFLVVRYLYPAGMIAWTLPGMALHGPVKERERITGAVLSTSSAKARKRNRAAGWVKPVLAVLFSVYLLSSYYPDARQVREREEKQNQKLVQTLEAMGDVSSGDEILTDVRHIAWTIGRCYFPQTEIRMFTPPENPLPDKEKISWLVVKNDKKNKETLAEILSRIKEQGFCLEERIENGNLGTHPVTVYRVWEGEETP